MNSTLVSSIVLSAALILSAYLLSHSISDLAQANQAPRQVWVNSNGQKIIVDLEGRMGFSDSMNALKIQQTSN